MIIKQSNSSKNKLGYSCGTNYAIQHLSYNKDTHQLILKQNPDIVFYIDLNTVKDKDRILHLNPVEDIIETTPNTPNDNVNYVVHNVESGKYEYYTYNVKLHNWNVFTLITGCEFYNKANHTKYLYDGINLINITHVNLSSLAEQDKIIVNNDKGTGFELLLATNTEAGLISPEEKSIINIINSEGFVSTASIQDIANKLSLAIKTYNPITKDYTVSTYGLREFELGKNGLVPAPKEARDDIFLNAKGKWVKLEFGELANTVVAAIAAEATRAKTEEAKLKLAISEETKRATNTEESIKNLVNNNSGELAVLKEAYKQADTEVLKTLRDEIKIISNTKVDTEQGKELMPSPNVAEDLKKSYFLSADGTWKKIESDDYVFVLEAIIPETITSETAVSLLNPDEAERYLKYYLEYISNTNLTKPSLFLKDTNGNYPSVLLDPIGLDNNTNKYIGISYYKEALYKPTVTFDYNVSKRNIQIFNIVLKVDLVQIATHDYVENATNKLRDIITTLLQNKVDKEEGKTLTSNDFTDTYKGVIDRIEEYINSIEIIAPEGSEELILASNKYSPVADSSVTVEQLFPNVTDTHSGLMSPSYKRALDNFVLGGTEMNIYGTPANRWQIDTTVDGPVFINKVGYVDFKSGLNKEAYANLVLNDINLKGVIKHEGTSFISNAQIIKFGDNTIEINSNETGEGVSDVLAGIEIYRGTLPKYNIYYDDADKILKSGETNGLYPILNADYLVDLTDTMFLGWDRATKRAKTTNKTGHAIYAPAFFRSPDNSETLYHADIVNDLTTGGTDKVLSAEVGKEIFKAIEEGTKYNSMFNDPEMPTTKTVGGIAAGTKLSKLEGKTFSQLFDNALFTEMQPSVTAPSASLKLTFTTLLEVGAPAPVKSNFTTSYSRGSATVAGQTDRYRAGILRPDESFIYYGGNTNNKDMYPEKVILGSMSWNYRAYYEQGDELVTSWGNKASINPNPLPAGYVTSSAVSISGTYPFFTNGQSCSSSSQDTNLPSTAGNMAKMSLMSWDTTLVGIKFASEAATNVRLAFQFPQAKTVTKVEFFNTVSGKWEVFGNANWNIKDIESKTVQGNPVKYSELTTTGALSGALQLRFTIANSGRPINDTTLREALYEFSFLDVNNDITNISDTGNRAEGVAKFAVNFEPGGQTPLDARTLVTTRADLINPNTYYAKNYYQGLYAITKDTLELWVLKDVTKITNTDYSGWKRLDVGAVPIIDNLTSTSTTSALSANQGKVLNEKIESLSSDVDSNYLKLTGGTLTGLVNFNAGLNVNSGNTVVQDITIKGNVTQEGQSFITKAETVNITDNILVLNNGEKGSGVTKGTSGIEVDRGSANNFLFVFDEVDDRFKAGYANSLQPIMLRDAESSLVADKFLYWDATNKISKTREIVINDISNLHTTWKSFLGNGLYIRNIGVNGIEWSFLSDINAATTSIYAPTTPGSVGQYLKSSGGTPVWNTLTMSDISDSANILNGYLPLSAGSNKPLTGMLYATGGILVPSGTGIKMWKENFYTWIEYMRAASEPSPTGGKLGTYGNVTSYARRSLIENLSGYGWVWESCANEANATTNPMMVLSSVNGNLYVKGDITAPTFRGDVVGNATTSNSFQNPFTFTIGLTSKNVKGDAQISYSLAEIGALPLTGGAMSANARISFPDTNLYIGNSNNKNWLFVQDIASQSGESYWKILNTGTALFQESVTSYKFIKSGSSDEYVLLGAGGHKALSDFAVSGHTHDYLPLSGGTITGPVYLNSDLIGTGSIKTTKTVEATRLLITQEGVQLGSTPDIGIYPASGSRIAAGAQVALGFNTGSLLVSSAWADYTKVPENGIYSKGIVKTDAGFSVIAAGKTNLNTQLPGANIFKVMTSTATINEGAPANYEHAIININGASGDYGVQIAVNWDYPKMYFRSINPNNGNNYYSWVNIADTTYVNDTINKLNYAASNTPGGPALTVIDSGNNSSTIKLAYQGNSLTASTAIHLAAFSNTLDNGARVLRDISATEALKFIGAAPSEHTHTSIEVLDNRDEIMTPDTTSISSIETFFNNNEMITTDWWSGISVRGWTPGYCTWQLAGPAGQTSNKGLYYRDGINNWNGWKKLATVEDDLTWNNIQGKPSSFTPNNVILDTYVDKYDLNTTPNSTIYISEVNTATNSPTNSTKGDIFSFWGDDEGLQLWASEDTQRLFYRIRWGKNNIGTWKKFANTSGIDMEAGARISASSGRLYIGNSDNAGWVCMQDMTSAASDSNWTIRTSGAAAFANNVTAKGFIKSGSNDNYILLGGGGHKALSELTVTLDKNKVLTALNQPGTNTFTTYCDFIAGAGNSGSDMRFKTNISPINNILSDLMKIKIFTYTWNKLGERQLDTLGVSANDLEDNSLFSKLVHERPDKDKTKFVDYDRLGVLALKGVQELVEENIKLKKALKDLSLELDIKLDI